mmetsp:Transcript_17378/g.29980  ORF Transcript_17378/g.29980 Transcript_17378/m.29980 type:complete len:268 (+) Transcript_17378:194-997(+)
MCLLMIFKRTIMFLLWICLLISFGDCSYWVVVVSYKPKNTAVACTPKSIHQMNNDNGDVHGRIQIDDGTCCPRSFHSSSHTIGTSSMVANDDPSAYCVGQGYGACLLLPSCYCYHICHVVKGFGRRGYGSHARLTGTYDSVRCDDNSFLSCCHHRDVSCAMKDCREGNDDDDGGGHDSSHRVHAPQSETATVPKWNQPIRNHHYCDLDPHSSRGGACQFDDYGDCDICPLGYPYFCPYCSTVNPRPWKIRTAYLMTVYVHPSSLRFY